MRGEGPGGSSEYPEHILNTTLCHNSLPSINLPIVLTYRLSRLLSPEFGVWADLEWRRCRGHPRSCGGPFSLQSLSGADSSLDQVVRSNYSSPSSFCLLPSSAPFICFHPFPSDRSGSLWVARCTRGSRSLVRSGGAYQMLFAGPLEYTVTGWPQN